MIDIPLPNDDGIFAPPPPPSGKGGGRGSGGGGGYLVLVPTLPRLFINKPGTNAILEGRLCLGNSSKEFWNLRILIWNLAKIVWHLKTLFWNVERTMYEFKWEKLIFQCY